MLQSNEIAKSSMHSIGILHKYYIRIFHYELYHINTYVWHAYTGIMPIYDKYGHTSHSRE